MKLKAIIGKLILGSDGHDARTLKKLYNMTSDQIKEQVAEIDHRYQIYVTTFPGNFAMLQLYTDIINFLRQEMDEQAWQIQLVIQLCQQKVIYYHNTQFQKDDSNKSTGLSQEGRDIEGQEGQVLQAK